jgi:sec-independent protein translocase protein TatA
MGLENPSHWLVVLVILLLVFGARRLPEIGRSLGTGLREFKDSLTGAGERDERPAVTAGSPAHPAEPQAPEAAPPASERPAATAQAGPPTPGQAPEPSRDEQ